MRDFIENNWGKWWFICGALSIGIATFGSFYYALFGDVKWVHVPVSIVYGSFNLFLILAVFRWIGLKLLPEKMSRTKTTDFKAKARTALKKASADGILAPFANNKPMRISIEDRASIIGPPGTGKTSFLVAQLIDWISTGRPFVCLDIKPEIYGILRDELDKAGYKSYIYNPTSQRGHRYNMLDDCHSAEQLGELASSLVASPDERAAIFNESARDFLDAIISHLKATEPSPSLATVNEYISRFVSFEDLLKDLTVSPDQDARDIASALTVSAGNGNLITSFFATIRQNLKFLRYPAIRSSLESSDFTLADVGKEKTALFLQFEETYGETTSKLFGVMVSHIMRYFIMNTNRPPLLLMLDEIGNSAPINDLPKKLNTIRSRNMPTWLYWQSKEQMQPYGRKSDEGANTIMGACDFQAVFRLNDNATAKWFSERVGTADDLVQNERSAMLQKSEVIPQHELQQLDDGMTLSLYRGSYWFGTATPYYKIYKQYKGKKPTPEQCLGEPYSAYTANTINQPIVDDDGYDAPAVVKNEADFSLDLK